MNMTQKTKVSGEMSFFDRYLSVWVALCIVAGIAIGKLLPVVPETLSRYEYANVSIPIAVLIWVMIFPMMLKIDFASVVNAVKMPKGLTVTLVVNWLIKPFTMFAIAWVFFYFIFKAFIPAERQRISGRRSASGSCALYGHGVCVESSYQRKSSIHAGAGGYQRFNYSGGFYPYCYAAPGNKWY
jgi:hypothetical protein